MTKVALVDDHQLIRNALAELINKFEGYQVIHEAGNGVEFLSQLEAYEAPDIALIDINMPLMNGFDTARKVADTYPDVKILALSVEDDEEAIIKMLRSGATGYLLKDTATKEFKLALDEINHKGYYHSDLVANTLLKSIKPEVNGKAVKAIINYQAREEEFLQLACSEMTYKEIADQMCVSPRTIDGYRENLFMKLEVKSRVGLVLFAIKNGIVEV
ncbi:response regulator transcription factor [Jiulongibacter sediminis]|jgi:DNA-binding NarL/FixJ family response regulator|uniref:response regulator transcription factor n=1 Tax=Jiulongibacter sediminis TaxID=1605367 RepID=UPI0026F2E2B8|nr:response regulator transcription factor [Jiulongibacter sediminis]